MGLLLVSLVAVSLVTSLLALGLSFLFNSLKGKISIRIKYFLWISLLLSLLLPLRPQFGSGLLQIDKGQLEQPLAATVSLGKTASTSLAPTGVWDKILTFPWLSSLIVVWFVGVALSLGWKVYHIWRFQHLLKRWGTPVVEQDVLDSLGVVKELLAITKPVKVVHYPLTHTPMLLGFRNPMILLPHLDYTDDELDLIFEHELTHFKHRDIYVNLLAVLVTSLHWFNPLVTFMAKETQEVAEAYCDHDVLSYQDKAYRTFYGETIISMIDQSRQKTSAMPSCFYSNKFNLKRRMEAIVSTEPSAKSLTGLAVLMVATSLLFSGSVFALVENTPVVADLAKAINRLSPEDLKAKISQALDQPQSALTDWELSETADLYLVRVSDQKKRHAYAISKWSGQVRTLSAEVLVPTQEETKASSSTNSSSSAGRASQTEAGAAASSEASSTQETGAGRATTSPAAQSGTTVTQVPATPVPVSQESVVQPVPAVEPLAPAAVVVPPAPEPVAPIAPLEVDDPSDDDDTPDDDDDDDD